MNKLLYLYMTEGKRSRDWWNGIVVNKVYYFMWFWLCIVV